MKKAPFSFTRAFLLWLGLLPFLGMLSCSPNELAKPEVTPPVLVGRVTKIFPRQKFVLIKKETLVTMPEENTILLSQDDEGKRIANLMVTGERLPGSPQFPADIRSGDPKVGDRVYVYRSMEHGSQGIRVLTPGESIASDSTSKTPGSPEAESDAIFDPKAKTDDIDFPALNDSKDFSTEGFPSKEEINTLLNETDAMPQ